MFLCDFKVMYRRLVITQLVASKSEIALGLESVLVISADRMAAGEEGIFVHVGRLLKLARGGIKHTHIM